LADRGIAKLYSHQAESFELVQQGHNLVVVTPTASGKTLCYNLPVLNLLLADPGARAMY
jgi:DEAD/DEAH box helicase domain-containing protein